MNPSVTKWLSQLTTLALLFPVHLAADSKLEVEGLDWMTGCWEGQSGKRQIEEHWTKPLGQSLLGMSRTVSGGKTIAYEFMRIHQEEAGVVFTAQPSGQKEASFRMVRSSGKEVVFENPDHDFPQRIMYRKDSLGGLVGRIEGKSNGKERGMDFPMKKTKCE